MESSSGGITPVAYPAQYQVSGVLTFLVDMDMKDLGKKTEDVVTAMTEYNPDEKLKKVTKKQPDVHHLWVGRRLVK